MMRLGGERGYRSQQRERARRFHLGSGTISGGVSEHLAAARRRGLHPDGGLASDESGTGEVPGEQGGAEGIRRGVDLPGEVGGVPGDSQFTQSTEEEDEIGRRWWGEAGTGERRLDELFRQAGTLVEGKPGVGDYTGATREEHPANGRVVKKKLSAPFFFLELPVEATGV